MEDKQDGYRRFLEIQIEGLQEQLYALERDPEQLEYLKSILRICQRLRHAQEGEPPAVRLLRNAVEKVTLHLGRADLAVTREVLDFYVDSFDLLEEAVRRWPGGPSFDRARYADRVRGLLESSQPRRDAMRAAGEGAGSRAGVGPAPSAWGGAALDEQGTADLADRLVLTQPSGRPADAGFQAAGAAASSTVGEEVPTWTEGGAATRGEEVRVELVPAQELTAEEREEYVELDLRDLLSDTWSSREWQSSGPSAGFGAERADGGGLAASYSTLETLRRSPAAEPWAYAPAGAAVSDEAQEALERLRDVLDAFSLSLSDLDLASERLLREGAAGLGDDTRTMLVARLEVERDKLLSVFDRTIDSFRSGAA